MAALVLTFPSTTSAPPARFCDANSFDRWAAETPLSHGELVTARFLLAVWNPGHEWRFGRFDMMEAIAVWDDRYRAAFIAWARDPFWS
jgi:hypothetical protein